MQESTTPYIKIEQNRDGGFGDLRRDVEMDTLPRESEHDALQPNQDVDSSWDSIFTLDLESCFVSISIPLPRDRKNRNSYWRWLSVFVCALCVFLCYFQLLLLYFHLRYYTQMQ